MVGPAGRPSWRSRFVQNGEEGDRLLLQLTLPIYLIVFYHKSKESEPEVWGEEERAFEAKTISTLFCSEFTHT